jgi:hypothetical protein
MASKKGSKRRNSDPLVEPIFAISPLLLALLGSKKSPEERSAMWREADLWVMEQRLAKLRLIAQRYGIDVTTDGPWLLLTLLRLAEERFEGLRVVDDASPRRRRRGRPRGSTKIGGLDLVKAIDSARLPDDRRLLDACTRLTRKRGGRWEGESPQSLETQYYAWHRDTKAKLASAAADPLIRRLERAAKAATLRDSQGGTDQGTDTTANNLFGLAMIGRSLNGS